MLKKDFDNTLKALEITRQDFSNLTGLAYSTISNWHDKDKPIPSWVDSWLENYIKAKKYDDIKELIKDR